MSLLFPPDWIPDAHHRLTTLAVRFRPAESNPAISTYETIAAPLRRRQRSNRFLTIAMTASCPRSFSARMHNPISIRDIRPGDIPEVLRINEQSSPGVSQLTVDGAERLTTDATLAWVAVGNRGIAGYLIAYLGSAIYAGEEFAWFKGRGRGFVYVDQIALAPSYRGRGVGSMLYSELERWGARQRCRSLNCEVNLDPPNPGSLAFHRRYGFIEIGRMHTTDGRHVALLQKDVGEA